MLARSAILPLVVLAACSIGIEAVAAAPPAGASTVTIRDVDHDNDLDLVVSDAASRRITSVWLNDGGWRFEDAGPQAAGAPFEPAQSADAATGAAVPPGAVEAGPLAFDVTPSAAAVSVSNPWRRGSDSSATLLTFTWSLSSRSPPVRARLVFC